MLAWLPVFPSFSSVSPAPQEVVAPVSANASVSSSTSVDPLNQLQEKVQFLQNGFFQPTTSGSANSINSEIGTTLTVDQLVLGQFLTRTGAPGAPITDTTPSASDLITFLTKYTSPFPVSQGFAWNVAYNNQTGQTVNLAAGTGVTIGTAISLSTGKISTLRVYVLNSDVGSEAVYISLLGN